MKSLNKYINEGFFTNIGANDFLVNAITGGSNTVVKYGVKPSGITSNIAISTITMISPTAIHVKVKGFGLSKKEFDIDFAEYEDKIHELAQGDFSNLKFNWNISNYARDADKYTMRFTNMNTYHDFFIDYVVNTGKLTRW